MEYEDLNEDSQVVNIKLMDVDGIAGWCGEMDTGEDVSLFPANSEGEFINLSRYIGMKLKEVYEFKRLHDWMANPQAILNALRED